MVGSSGTPNESLKDAFAADGFSRRLAAAGANALLGLGFDGGIPRGDFAQQGHLPARRGLQVGRSPAHTDWPALGKRQCRVAPCTARLHACKNAQVLLECGERLAGLRADPNFAAFEHFFFPDRHGLFDFFNGEAASRECRVAVRR